MKGSAFTENLVKLFSDLEIQRKSGVDIVSESSLMMSSKGIAKEMEKRYRKKIRCIHASTSHKPEEFPFFS